jgi:hypothetical protein
MEIRSDIEAACGPSVELWGEDEKMSSLKVEVAGTKAVLSGYLDENSDLTRLADSPAELTINFKDVTRVNSCGVREWVNLLAKVPNTALKYEECPMIVVKQLNAVPDFQGKAKISTFYAPYFCEECDEEAMRLLDVSQITSDKAPDQACEKCKKPLNFDAIANQYFSFIKR